MEWIGYIFLALVAGAAVLAIYEWRKGVKLREDIVHPASGSNGSDRAAYAQAERIHAEDVAIQNRVNKHS